MGSASVIFLISIKCMRNLLRSGEAGNYLFSAAICFSNLVVLSDQRREREREREWFYETYESSTMPSFPIALNENTIAASENNFPPRNIAESFV